MTTTFPDLSTGYYLDDSINSFHGTYSQSQFELNKLICDGESQFVTCSIEEITISITNDALYQLNTFRTFITSILDKEEVNIIYNSRFQTADDTNFELFDADTLQSHFFTGEICQLTSEGDDCHMESYISLIVGLSFGALFIVLIILT